MARPANYDPNNAPAGPTLPPNTPQFAIVSWSFPTLQSEAAHIGFEIVLYTGSNPDTVANQKSLILVIKDVNERGPVSVSIGPSRTTANSLNAAVRAIYQWGNGPWGGSGITAVQNVASPVSVEAAGINYLGNASFEACTVNTAVNSMAPDGWSSFAYGTSNLVATGGYNNSQYWHFVITTGGNNAYIASNTGGGTQGLTINGVYPAMVKGVWYVGSFYAQGSGSNIGLTPTLYFGGTVPTVLQVISQPALTSSWQRYAFRFWWDPTTSPTLSQAFEVILYAAQLGNFDIDAVMLSEGASLQPFSARPIHAADEATSRALTTIESVSTKVFYRGNISTTTKGGAPNNLIATSYGVNIQAFHGSTMATGTSCYQYGLYIQPSAASDNYETLSYAAIKIYTSSSSGSLVRTQNISLNDRVFTDPTTDTTATNQHATSFQVFLLTAYVNSSSYPALYFQLQLWNAYGPSDWYDFAPVTSYYSNYTRGAGGTLITGGSSGGGGGNGGGAGGGGNCLAPETPVVIAQDGTAKPLGEMKVGDYVWTQPETGGPMGNYRVGAVKLASNVRCRVTFNDGRSFVSSINHQICVRGLWRRVDSLHVGEEVEGGLVGFVKSIEYLGEGPVVQILVDEAHTYFAGDGGWHHNQRKV